MHDFGDETHLVKWYSLWTNHFQITQKHNTKNNSYRNGDIMKVTQILPEQPFANWDGKFWLYPIKSLAIFWQMPSEITKLLYIRLLLIQFTPLLYKSVKFFIEEFPIWFPFLYRKFDQSKNDSLCMPNRMLSCRVQ